ESSIEIDNILSGYERQIEIYSKIEKSIMPFEPSVLKIDKDNLGKLSKSIYKTFNEHGILVEQYFANHDMFDLWEEYLKGNHMVFTNALKKSLSRKHLLAIRKAFDDNTEFHNVVIKFLFAMEGLIKELTSPKQMTKNEILNFAVNSSLDKIYFTLIKALNSAE
ncbi:MAG: hypothetical protein IKW39_00615, partial [Alphaproteobacteria bacterium]|nr:hypothetical protein [Alphaproteobacteria bacterium]